MYRSRISSESQNAQHFLHGNRITPSTSHPSHISMKPTILTLPANDEYQHVYKSPSNEYQHVYISNAGSGLTRFQSLHEKRKQRYRKKLQAFACSSTSLSYTKSCPRLSTKAQIAKKKLSSESIRDYTHNRAQRQLAASYNFMHKDNKQCNIDSWQNVQQNKFRNKNNSMLKTKTDFEYQRQLTQIPSVVISHDSSQNNTTSQGESEETEKSTSHSTQDNNNGVYHCESKMESNV